MKYKVGDKVKVRSYLKENMALNEELYDVTKYMVKFKDKWVTISKVLENLCCYELEEDEIKNGWTEEMFSQKRELVYPAIYKHFKHTKDGIPNNYMYAVKFISNPVSVDWINKEMEKDVNIVENTCYFEHTELKEKSISFLINNKWYHSDEFSKDKLVVYCAMYNDHIDYARPYDMFMGEVDHEKYPDVKQKYRFELVI